MMRKLALVSLLLLSACGAQEAVTNANAEVARFHGQLDRADYETIWKTSGEAMRQSGPKEEFVKFLRAVHTKLGNVKESKSAGWNVNSNTGGSFVTVQENTTFEKGNGAETFIFSRDGDHLTLIGYQINSREMMIN
jgi:hypothetical protein